ncbi:MAG TPA: hypothetical protein VEA80_14420 [Vitreimonas sp.]|uniref:hypothetical protein n=1 Tax=Vitreimonas sp. TaxID=3069702 RepID=UPI002D5C80CA|nr:hypothetical protein [Vitreimonas sp.]HYD88666.1 hypothetical protein [Vitreimonas sp.]
MTTVMRSSLATSLARYRRSWGLWLLLLIAPIGARYMLPIDGTGVIIAIGNQLPEMTSPFLGVSLGIVVSTLMLPIAWLYLRSNTTRRQPWQIEEITPASRVAIALGRFGADVLVLLAMLAALTVAGWFLGWLLVPPRPFNLAEIAFALWLVAAPALMGLAALRVLFDARPLLRSGFGDFLYFVLWIASIAVPAATQGQSPSFATNMVDFAGFVTPLQYGAPGEPGDFAIGGADVEPGHVQLDVMAGLLSPGYIASRWAWAAIAVAIAALAGLIYRPHLTRRRRGKPGRLTTWLAAGPPPRAIADAPPARRASLAWLNLVGAEFKLIGSGRAFWLLAASIAVASALVDFRHMASPAALLLLAFALSAHAGRSEARGLLRLTKTAPFAPMARRAAFVAAGAGWTTLLALPALVRAPALDTLGLAVGTGAAAALIASALASVSGSAFAPRLVLLVLWYGYFSAP